MHDLDQRIRAAHAPIAIDDRGLDAAWSDVAARLDRAPTARARRVRRSRSRSVRTIVAIAIAVVALASVALAQESVREALGIDRHRPAGQMEVFTKPSDITVEDLEMAEMLQRGYGGANAGDPDLSKLHEVLDFREGDFRARIYSFPTSTQKACLYSEFFRKGRLTSGGGGCDGGVRFNGFVSTGWSDSTRDGFTAYGLATDRVEQVRVVLRDGSRRDATMGDNAWLWHGPPHSQRGSYLEVELRNGTIVEVAMNGCLRRHAKRPNRSRLGCGFGMNREPGALDT